jgi:isopenicillin N synthase-like dioxygenase
MQGAGCAVQVLRDGQWYTVQPIPGAITVNVGDMAQVNTRALAGLFACVGTDSRVCRDGQPGRAVKVQPTG